jgi:D-3-phosphoglycerate dehydrogenase
MKCLIIGDRGIPETYFLKKMKYLEQYGVVFTTVNLDKSMDDAAFYAHLRRIETQGPEGIKINNEILREIKDAEILAIHWAPVNKELLENAKKLKIIALSRAGFENINLGVAKEKNLWIVNAPGRNKEAVADHAITLFLAARRRIPYIHNNILDGNWESFYPEKDLQNMIAGVIGFGNVGKETAKLLNGLGLKVLAYDPFADKDEMKNYNIVKVTIDKLLEESDVIFMHARMSDENKGMINMEAFKKMKKRPVFVNNARSMLVYTDALVTALDEKLISAAGLDVFDEEPLPKNSPLLKFDNVVLTPHCSNTIESLMYNGPAIIAREIESILKNKKATFAILKPDS